LLPDGRLSDPQAVLSYTIAGILFWSMEKPKFSGSGTSDLGKGE